MKAGKKLGIILTSLFMCVTLLGGCGINKDESLVTIKTADGTDTISLAYGNFVARFTQSSYDSVYAQAYGNGYWVDEMQEGVTFSDQVKDGVLESLENEYLMKKHAADYGITLSEEEQKKIDEVAKAFIEANDKEVLEEISADEEVVKQYLTNQYYSYKVSEAIAAEAEATIEDETARSEYQTKKLEEWKAEITWTVDEKAWEKVRFDTLFEMPEVEDSATAE